MPPSSVKKKGKAKAAAPIPSPAPSTPHSAQAGPPEPEPEPEAPPPPPIPETPEDPIFELMHERQDLYYKEMEKVAAAAYAERQAARKGRFDAIANRAMRVPKRPDDPFRGIIPEWVAGMRRRRHFCLETFAPSIRRRS